MSCVSFQVLPSKATVHSPNYATTAQKTFRTLLGLPSKPVAYSYYYLKDRFNF